MSTPAATARYVIAADDKTASGVRSAIKNFKEMDRDIRGTLRTLNTVLGVAIGVQLTQGFRKVLEATAKSNTAFGASLRSVKDAATDLLSAHSGLPEATKQLNELRDVLKDPATKSAADTITSALIKGFSTAAKFTAEMLAGFREITRDKSLGSAKTLQEQNANLDALIQQKRDRLTGLQTGTNKFGRGPGLSENQQALITQVKKEIADLEAAQNRILDLTPAELKDIGRGHLAPTPANPISRASSAQDIQEAVEDAARDKRIASTKAEIAVIQADTAVRQQHIDDILRSSDQYLDNQKQIAALEEFDLNAIEAKKEVFKELVVQSEYAKEAARNIQDSFAEFLFDPFKDGLKGMLRQFLDTIRRIAAEMAAQKLLGPKREGGLGFADLIGNFLFDGFGGNGLSPVTPTVKKLPAFATGGSFKVGGSGGVDSQVVAFRASPGESVDVGRGKGLVYAPSFYIDAKTGADEDRLRSVVKTASDSAVSRVLELKERGAI